MIFRHELTRLTRRGRCHLFVGGYLLALLLVLAGVYVGWFGTRAPLEALAGGNLSVGELARFNQHVTTAFLLTQMAAVCVLTPILMADAIAGERQRRTLEVLLSTPVPNAEIVFDKLAARLLVVAAVLLAGVPFLSALQLWGGTNAPVLLQSYAVMMVTAVSLGGAVLFGSVIARSPAGAVAWVWWVLLFSGAGTFWEFGRWLSDVPDSDATLSRSLSCGIAFATLLLGAALLGLRKSPTPDEAGTGPRPPHWLDRLTCSRPPVSDRLLLWKELYFHGGMASAAPRRVLQFVTLLAFGLTLPRAEAVVRPLGTFLACVLWLAVSLRAAGGLSGERDRRTLDSLLLLPVGRTHLLGVQWLGSVLSMRLGIYCLLAVWLAGLVTGSVSPLAVGMVLLVLAAHLAFAASVGLWFSVVAGRLRAMLGSAAILAALSGTPFLLGAGTPFLFKQRPWEVILLAFAGPESFSLLAWPAPAPDADMTTRLSAGLSAGLAKRVLPGFLAFHTLAALLWLDARRRFRREAGRD